MTPSEMPRPVKVKALTEEPYRIEATAPERAALAERFAVVGLGSLTAELVLTPKGNAVEAAGTLNARWTQSCAVSGEDLAMTADEDLFIRFVPDLAPNAASTPQEEIELDADQLDEIEYDGDSFDLGEAVAQSFGLTIDPYAAGPDADRVRQEKGVAVEGEQDGPLAELLAGLKPN